MKLVFRLYVLWLWGCNFLLSCLFGLTFFIQIFDFLIYGKNRIYNWISSKIETNFDFIHELNNDKT